MKKLLILLFSILISLNSYGEELKGLFGIDLYDNAEKYISSNYINSNKWKNRETLDGYFDLDITDKIKIKSPYASAYKITIDNDNKIHSIYGDNLVNNLDVCLQTQKDLLPALEKKYQIDFKYWEHSYPTFKIYRNYQSTSSVLLLIQCREDYEDFSILRQISLSTMLLMNEKNDFYNAGL
jgi:hypothetical protein